MTAQPWPRRKRPAETDAVPASPASPADGPRRLHVGPDAIGVGGSVENSACAPDSRVTNIGELHIHHAAAGAEPRGGSLPEIESALADLQGHADRLATHAERLAALERRPAPHADADLADLADLRHYATQVDAYADRLIIVERRLADLQSHGVRLAAYADRLAALEGQLADFQQRHVDTLAANARLQEQHDAAYASAAASEADHRAERRRREAAEAAGQRADQQAAAERARADQYAAERDDALRRPHQEEREPVAVLSGPSPATTVNTAAAAPARTAGTARPKHMHQQVVRAAGDEIVFGSSSCDKRWCLRRRRRLVHFSRFGLKRPHVKYQRVGGMKLPRLVGSCSSRWCSHCFRQDHGAGLGTAVAVLGMVACVAAGIGLYRVDAPWWIGFPAVLGLFFAIPFAVDRIDLSHPQPSRLDPSGTDDTPIVPS
ncbi:hypothetical protein [Streptomyces sp. NPDC020951]|uniref:hypothetical protein n=1 Tax=Streptomyces sp. NPDC020951 TaxID=3365104 RepID=UPI0037ABFEA5